MSDSSSGSKKLAAYETIEAVGSRTSSLRVGEVHALKSPLDAIHTFKSPLDGAKLGYEEAQLNLAFAAETGYQPELRRNFSIWALLGVGFGITNSWFGISSALVTAISSGGPMMVIYGILIVASISFCIAITLSELASSMPNAGGQYYWTMRLAPPKLSPLMSYLCGAYAWAGSVFTSASITIAVATLIVAAYYIGTGRTDSPPRWSIFVTYEIVNLLLVTFNIWEKPLPIISQSSLYISVLSCFLITIIILAKSSGNFQSAEFVFVEFSNGTGWSSSGIAFIVGLINPTWAFSCLDAATHLSEETMAPETDIPKAIIGTVVVGLVTSLMYAISMFFSIKDLDDVLNSVSGMPIFDIYHQVLGSRAGTMGLAVLLGLTGVGCNVSSHTWQARLCWSFARDNGLPGSRYWSKVSSTGVPIYAHLMSCFWCAIIGCIYMASTTAYNAVVIGCITFMLISYSIPIVFLLIKGRNNIKHGPFWLGKIGLFCNIVVICWTIFAVVFFSFPPVMPVTPTNMNYVSCVTAAFTIYVFVYWFARGKRTFKSLEERTKSIPQLTAIVSQQMENAELEAELKY